MQIVGAHGVLSDHYNPPTKKLALLEPVYASDSIAAVGVATHEAAVRECLALTEKLAAGMAHDAVASGTPSSRPAAGKLE